MVIALNMMDMLKSRGIEIDVQKLEHHLGIPVIPVAASRGRGIKELIDRAHHTGENQAGAVLAPFDEQRLAERINDKYGMNPYISHQLHERREHHGSEYRSTYVIDEIYTGRVLEAILRIEDIIEPKCMEKGMALRWSAVK